MGKLTLTVLKRRITEMKRDIQLYSGQIYFTDNLMEALHNVSHSELKNEQLNYILIVQFSVMKSHWREMMKPNGRHIKCLDI